jgi:hypothetical protein
LAKIFDLESCIFKYSIRKDMYNVFLPSISYLFTSMQ